MKSSKIWNELGNTYFKFGDLEKAIDAYRNAIEHQSDAFGISAVRDSGLSYSCLASVLVQQGKFLEAVPLYQKSLELLKDKKEQASIWGSLGSIYHHLNEHGKAIQAFQKADELMPMVVTGKSGSAEMQDLDESAIDLALAGKSLKPGMDSVPMGLGGDKNDQENPNVWNELGLVLFKVGSYEDAIDAFIKAIELDPSIGYYYCNLGQVLVSQGRLTDAIELFEKSLELFQNNLDKSVSWNRLGDIYRQLGLMSESQAAYKLTEVLMTSVSTNQNEYRVLDLQTIINENGQVRDQL